MSDDAVPPKSRTFVIGSEHFILKDNAPLPTFIDLIVEAHVNNGSFYLSVGAGSVDFGNQGVVEVVNRMRFDLTTAQNIRNALDGMIEQALNPPDKSKAN